MKKENKTLKIIIKILTLLLALIGTCFLGYKVGTTTLGPVARYNYHLDDNGNIQSDNDFNLQAQHYKTNNLMISDNGFYVQDLQANNMYVLLYDANNEYRDTLYTSGSNYSQNYFMIDSEGLNGYYLYFTFGVVNSSNEYIAYKMNDIKGNFYNYWHFTFDTYFSDTISYMGNFSIVINSEVTNRPYNYEPFGTWYTPQTFARSQWQANYSTLINSKYDMTIYKDNTFQPSDELLIQYEEPQQDNTNRFYISLEKDSNTPNWPSAPYLGQWIGQEFPVQYPHISPGYFSINNSMKNLIALIQISIDIKGHNDPNYRTQLIFHLGGDKNGYYYDIDDEINYYVSSAALETIDMQHDLKIEIPQAIIEQLQTRDVDYISYNLKGNTTLEEFNFYLDTDIFGYNINYEQVYNTGYDLGYNNGYANALNFEWIKAAFNCVDMFFNTKLIGSITLGNIIAIPLIIGVVKFVIGWFK